LEPIGTTTVRLRLRNCSISIQVLWCRSMSGPLQTKDLEIGGGGQGLRTAKL
jgi:hypothetical protein